MLTGPFGAGRPGCSLSAARLGTARQTGASGTTRVCRIGRRGRGSMERKSPQRQRWLAPGVIPLRISSRVHRHVEEEAQEVMPRLEHGRKQRLAVMTIPEQMRCSAWRDHAFAGCQSRHSPSIMTRSRPCRTMNSSSAFGWKCCRPVPVSIPPRSRNTSMRTLSAPSSMWMKMKVSPLNALRIQAPGCESPPSRSPALLGKYARVCSAPDCSTTVCWMMRSRSLRLPCRPQLRWLPSRAMIPSAAPQLGTSAAFAFNPPAQMPIVAP